MCIIYLFVIKPNDGDAKFSDVWPIENIWGIMKEKTRGKTFENLDSLVGFVNSEWRKITLEQCEAVIDNMHGEETLYNYNNIF